MNAISIGGDDNKYADSVDLYFIISHGDYTNGELLLLFDTKVDDWFGHSKTWKFGDTCNMEWLLIYSCDSIDGDHVQQHLHLFRRMHLFCGSYGDMFDSFTIDEVGEDSANNLTSGKTVTDSWEMACRTGGSPIIRWFSVENRISYNNGDVDWEATMIRDVRAGRAATIEVNLSNATFCFYWSFEDLEGDRTLISQRMVLSGEDPTIFLDQAKVMGETSPEGVKKLVAAMERARSLIS
jgi:hypothetical protein